MNSALLADSRIVSAIDELKQLILARFPDACFDLASGPESDSIYLVALVDTEDLDDVMEVYIDRLVDLQVEERLPVYVISLHPHKDRQQSISPPVQSNTVA